MTKTYIITTITEVDGKIVSTPVGTFSNIDKAFRAAEKAAGKGCEFRPHYGPNSSCYVGSDVTAVIVRN